MAWIVILIASFLSALVSGGPLNELTVEENGMRNSLRFIKNHPLNKNRPASFLLGSPLTYEESLFTLLPVLENIDASHVEQYIQLYEDTDGLNTSASDGLPLHDLWLIPGYYLMSLKEAVETRMTMKRISDVWSPTWLPVFSSRAGDFIVFDLSNGRVFEIFTKESMVWEVAANIEEFFRQSAQNLRSGKVFVGEDGLMDESMADDGVLNEDYHLIQIHEKTSYLTVDQLFERIYSSRNVNNRPVSEMNVDSDVRQPNLYFNCRNMLNVCANIRNAINNNHKTRNLQRTTNRSQIRRNRRLSCGRLRCARGWSCDEYPFASTFQGGRGATIRCVRARENSSQGGQLNAFYNRNGVRHGSWFHQRYP